MQWEKHAEEETAVPQGDNTKAPKKRRIRPQNYGDLSTTEKKNKEYDEKMVTNSALTADHYKGKNDYERATDELFTRCPIRKKEKKETKQQKVIQPEYSFLTAWYYVGVIIVLFCFSFI
ncbi:hypothetical protein RFI_39604 [Reticulomyxa filosa]|uniref:Uncharacterized protein n=1 Tax=Reticulomyxa filosa TaxID=46433 RepID=X6L7Q8_RETFI|nr:hypothetical protein RFI_39604 [Reticulomyxa filosa]|eukprot:ETN97922.1 hypothetical protein RFI_39604 [Reticulomyxa filosa]